MENENFKCALTDLVNAIKDVCLGSIEHTVIESAGKSLIESWNDHAEFGDKIDEAKELRNLENFNY